MRTLLQRIAILALPLALLVVSACSGHHRFHHDRDTWHDEAYNRGASVNHYDQRGQDNGWDQYNGRSRYNDSQWLRW